jgi:hypothetical protein
MSVLVMTAEQRAEVESAQRQSRNVRHWTQSGSEHGHLGQCQCVANLHGRLGLFGT